MRSAEAGSAEAGSVGVGAAIRFQEVYSRAPWENRFDMTVLRGPAPPMMEGEAGGQARGQASSWTPSSQAESLQVTSSQEGEMAPWLDGPGSRVQPGQGSRVQGPGSRVQGSRVQPGQPSSSSAPWEALLVAINSLVRPVLAASGLFGSSSDELCVEAVGCVLSLPGAPDQPRHPSYTRMHMNVLSMHMHMHAHGVHCMHVCAPGAPDQLWHPDCVRRVGLVNAFVPLVPLSDTNGPTALALASHTPPIPCCPLVVRPLLAAGEVTLIDRP